MNSCLYEGHVVHDRTLPVRHRFRYRMFMMCIDLSELNTVFNSRWFWSVDRPNLATFRRRDYFGDPARPLDDEVRRLVEDQTGRRPDGPICLLTHLTYFGFCFNPVSFYFCFDRQMKVVDTIVAEINNTPWNERHCYVLDRSESEVGDKHQRYTFDKAFHVSPFMDMTLGYQWDFAFEDSAMQITMKNRDSGRLFFEAQLSLTRKEITGATMAYALARHPFLTLKVIAAIYWQAFRLWRKKTPFFPHPATVAGSSQAS